MSSRAGNGASRPAVFTIAPSLPFADTLAAGILKDGGGDPMALARTTILLPTRRAVRALRDAFLRQRGGEALILPRLQPIGDIDEDEIDLGGGLAAGGALDIAPAMPDLRRRVLLARLILARVEAAGIERITADQAIWQAAELARLLDEVRIERLSFDGLAELVPAEHAEHWQITLDFLAIVTARWPEMLAEEGCLDPPERRNLLLAAQAESWRRAPPADPVIAAGSTGSVPATADLLDVVAHLPRGAVVLPGFDRHGDDRSWDGIEPSHPQFALAALLERLGVARADVRDWGGGDAMTAGTEGGREALIAEALRPADTTDAWRDISLSSDAVGEALDGVERIDCATPREEAAIVALIMREALESPARTAALVTPDRALARRVSAELGRWNIEVDDSAGTSLATTVPGAFLRLVANAVAEELAPVALLAALKHPLAACGRAPEAFRGQLRRLEERALRGPRPAPGLAGLRAVLDRAEAAEFGPWLDDLERRLKPLLAAFARPACPPEELLRAHVTVAEALAESAEESGPARLWRGEAGEAAADFIADALSVWREFPDIARGEYPSVFEALMSGRMVRPRYGRHPRLNIWGPLEARLQRADVMILGGLNEGTWPLEITVDPWMSRPMRAAFGLPAPERRIGLAAHDFAQGFCAGRVVLTRAARVGGGPTVPSRWLLRLETVLGGLGLRLPRGDRWLDWRRRLDAAEQTRPVAAPAPRPPVRARPRHLSVTQIERWMRDPYMIYARHVLKLSKLDPLDADAGAADRGNFIHQALEKFIAETPHDPGLNDLARLLKIGMEVLGREGTRPEIKALWWPRFERIADWFVKLEHRRRADITASRTEVKGEISIAGPAGEFTLSAVADRIDRRADGTLAIIDYKTGAVPSPKDIAAGRAPQLPLEAAIAAQGGFADIPAAEVAELAHWKLSGGAPAGMIMPVTHGAAALAEAALAGLRDLVARFDDETTPYLAQPRGEVRYNDYAHLARTREWSVLDEESQA